MWFERLLARVAPDRAQRRLRARLAFERLAAHYDGAQNTRRTRNWTTPRTGPNAEIQPALPVLRSRARDLVRNNPFAAAGLDLIVSYQVGTGIVPRSATGDNALDAQVDAAFARWCAGADAARRTDFYGLQASLARSRAEAGEALAILTPISRAEAQRRGLAVPLVLQVIEPDHLDELSDRLVRRDEGPIIHQGVEIDAMGAPVAYHLRVDHPGETLVVGLATMRTQRVEAGRVVHVFRADRPGQVRGVPDLAPVMTRLRSLDELEDAALEREKVQACLAAFVTSPAPASAGPLEGTDAAGDPVKTLYPGMVERLMPGEGVDFATPSGAAGFSDLARHQLHAIATGWGLTYDLLTGDLSQANYSSLRAGRLAFKRRLERTQWHVLVPAFQRIWDAWAQAAIVAGVLEPRESYPCAWAPPVFELVDPLKDAQAVKEQLRMGLLTWGQAVAQMGWEPRRQAEEIAEWNAELDERGLILDGDPRRTGGSGGAQDQRVNSAIEIAATGAAGDGSGTAAPAASQPMVRVDLGQDVAASVRDALAPAVAAAAAAARSAGDAAGVARDAAETTREAAADMAGAVTAQAERMDQALRAAVTATRASEQAVQAAADLRRPRRQEVVRDAWGRIIGTKEAD